MQKNFSSSGNTQKWSKWSCEHFHTFDWSTPSCRTTRFWHFWFFVENQNQDMAFWGPTYYIFPRRCMRWYEYLEFIFKHFWELFRRGKVDSHARRHLLMTLIIFKNQNPVKVTSKSGNRTKNYVRKVVSVFFRILMYIWYDPENEGSGVLMSGGPLDLLQSICWFEEVFLISFWKVWDVASFLRTSWKFFLRSRRHQFWFILLMYFMLKLDWKSYVFIFLQEVPIHKICLSGWLEVTYCSSGGVSIMIGNTSQVCSKNVKNFKKLFLTWKSRKHRLFTSHFFKDFRYYFPLPFFTKLFFESENFFAKKFE